MLYKLIKSSNDKGSFPKSFALFILEGPGFSPEIIIDLEETLLTTLPPLFKIISFKLSLLIYSKVPVITKLNLSRDVPFFSDLFCAKFKPKSFNFFSSSKLIGSLKYFFKLMAIFSPISSTFNMSSYDAFIKSLIVGK